MSLISETMKRLNKKFKRNLPTNTMSDLMLQLKLWYHSSQLLVGTVFFKKPSLTDF